MAEVTRDDLNRMRDENQEYFRQSTDLKFQKEMDKTLDGIDKQSVVFSSAIKQMEKVSSKVFEASTRKENVAAEKSLKALEQLIAQGEGKTSREEQDALTMLLREMKTVNKSLAQNENSLRVALGDSLKNNLPSLAGILGTIGLDNPAFLFIGSMMQDMMDKRREAARVRNKMFEDQHKEVLSADLNAKKESREQTKKQIEQNKDIVDNLEKPNETDQLLIQAQNDNKDAVTDSNAILESLNQTDQLLVQAQNDNKDAVSTGNVLLQHLTESINSLVKNSEASTFAEIERRRESERQNELLVGAISGISLGDDLNFEDEKGNALLQMMGLNEAFQSFMMGLAGISTFLATAGKTIKSGGARLLRSVGRFAGPVGLAVTAFYAVTDGVEGWNNAAEKLGKDVATTTDKMASAIGGTLGGIAGIADSLFGLVGIETDIGSFVDQKTTELLASYYDMIKGTVNRIKGFFTNIFSISFPEGFSLTEMLKAPYRLIWGWWKALFNLENLNFGDMSIAEYVETKTAELLGSVKGVFKDVVATAKEKFSGIIEKAKETFTFDFEIPDFKAIVSDFFKSIKDVFKNFSVTKLLDKIPFFGKDKEEQKIEAPAQTKIEIPEERPSSIITEKNTDKLIDDLDDKKVVDKKIWRKDTVSDWEAVNDLNRKQIAGLIEYGDFADKTKEKLQDILTSKNNESLDAMNPRSTLSTRSADYLNQEAAEKENEKKNVIINTPTTSNVNNVNKTQNSYNVTATPYEDDPTLRQINTGYGF